MAIRVYLAATLRRYLPGYDAAVGHEMAVEKGVSVRDVARELGLNEDEVKLLMVDGIGAKWETKLEGNERVAFFPPVGGG